MVVAKQILADLEEEGAADLVAPFTFRLFADRMRQTATELCHLVLDATPLHR
jgi:hypothetical protein